MNKPNPYAVSTRVFALIELPVTEEDRSMGAENPAQTVQNIIGHTGARTIAATTREPTIRQSEGKRSGYTLIHRDTF